MFIPLLSVTSTMWSYPSSTSCCSFSISQFCTISITCSSMSVKYDRFRRISEWSRAVRPVPSLAATLTPYFIKALMNCFEQLFEIALNRIVCPREFLTFKSDTRKILWIIASGARFSKEISWKTEIILSKDCTSNLKRIYYKANKWKETSVKTAKQWKTKLFFFPDKYTFKKYQ